MAEKKRKRGLDLHRHFPKELNYRQRELVRHLIVDGMTPQAAAKASGYSETTPVRQVMNHPVVQKTIASIMDELDMDDVALCKVLKEGLGATKVLGAVPKRATTGGDLAELPTAGPQTMDFIDVPDHKTRHSYLKTALKLRGHLAQQVDVKHSVETYEERIKRLSGEQPIDAEFSEA